MAKETDAAAGGKSGESPGPGQGALRAARRHLRWGWWSLLFFLTLGMVLEVLIGFRYLGEVQEMRRTMWRLTHAHGTLLSLVHIAWGATLPLLGRSGLRLRVVASPCLYAASIALPGGFALGGAFIKRGGVEPGIGVVLVPVGGAVLFVAVLLAAIAASRRVGDDEKRGN
ncbi:MAG: hypothetical protein HYS13_04955 [Planctomycetia bacterium]|nr:hypothetical protein [Planctomycetia bacterium]